MFIWSQSLIHFLSKGKVSILKFFMDIHKHLLLLMDLNKTLKKSYSMVIPTIWIVLFHQESVSLQCCPTHHSRYGVYEFQVGTKQHKVFITKLWAMILNRVCMWAAVSVDKVRVTEFYNRTLWWFFGWCHKQRKYWLTRSSRWCF